MTRQGASSAWRSDAALERLGAGLLATLALAYRPVHRREGRARASSSTRARSARRRTASAGEAICTCPGARGIRVRPAARRDRRRSGGGRRGEEKGRWVSLWRTPGPGHPRLLSLKVAAPLDPRPPRQALGVRVRRARPLARRSVDAPTFVEGRRGRRNRSFDQTIPATRPGRGIETQRARAVRGRAPSRREAIEVVDAPVESARARRVRQPELLHVQVVENVEGGCSAARRWPARPCPDRRAHPTRTSAGGRRVVAEAARTTGAP